MRNFLSSVLTSDKQAADRLQSQSQLPSSPLVDRLLEQRPEYLVGSAFTLGCITTFISLKIYSRYFRRFRTSDWVTPDALAQRRWIKGIATTVGDADNFRFYHTPGPGWHLPLKFRPIPSKTKDLKDQTLHIRMAGVDAPEAAHFGRPSQPFSEEALSWTKEQIEGKELYCQLIQKDQYSRIVAIVMLRRALCPRFLTPWFGKCLSLEMLKAGWATTYEQSGAVYGKWGKEVFLTTEATAKIMKLGQWKDGVSGESPAEYKRRFSQQGVSAKDKLADVDIEKASSAPPARRSWLRRMFGG